MIIIMIIIIIIQGMSTIAPKSDFDNDGGRAFMRGRGGRGGLMDAGMRRARL